MSAAPRPSASHSPLGWLERLTLVQVGVLLLFASWAFGGGAAWARQWIAAWGSLSLILFLLAVRQRDLRGEGLPPPVRWLWPFAGFNGLVLASCLNPSFSPMAYGREALIAFTGAAHPRLPSTAHVLTTLQHLWLFDAIYLSGFNLLVVIRRRRTLRGLLLVAVGNAVVLSVFGTFQRLASTGLYFGLVPAPNARFFATFIYSNHWAAYIVLLIAACAGLLFYYARRENECLISGSPVAVGLIGLLLMAFTPALAGSRAGALLVLVLLGTCALRILQRLRRERRDRGESLALPVAGLLAAGLLAVGGAVYLGHDSLEERWHDTQGQWQTGLLGERLQLYADTCRLAAAHPVFGWGLGSFDKTLQLIRPRPLEANRQYEHSYVDAHSDWLQSLAEVGVIGTILMGLCGLWPLWQARALRPAGPVPGYLLGGCGLILLYAGVEFPFGNPAVVVTFWLCFFSAIQYARLQRRATASSGKPAAFPS
jgi:O-antigen ligase